MELEFAEEAIREIAKEAIHRTTGARGLRAILEELMQNVMFEVPSDATIKKVIITKEAVLKQKEPILVRNAVKVIGTHSKAGEITG